MADKQVKALIMYPSTLDALECRLRYDWAYRKRYASTKHRDALEFGTAIHAALEAHYANGDDPVKVFCDWMSSHTITIARLESDNMRELGETMLKNYLEKYKRDNWDVYATELELTREVPIPKDAGSVPPRARRFLVGARVDLVIRDRVLDKVFVVEHKTFDRWFPGELEQNPQFVIEKYVVEGWAARPVSGVIVNGLRKRKVQTASTRLFERFTVYVSDYQVDKMLYRVYYQMLQAFAPKFKVYPKPSSLKCQYCSFRQPCAEYMRGGDYQFILDNLFEKRPERDP